MTDHLDILLTRAALCGDPAIARKAHRARAALAEIAADLLALRRRESAARWRTRRVQP